MARQRSQTSLQSSDLALAIKPLLVAYAPNRQVAISADKKDCIMGDYPTLAGVNAQYGDNRVAKAWLIPQITNLVEFANRKSIITEEQVIDCAGIILNEYYYLKLSELMLFFHWFKAGRYEHFYDTIDPMVILASLRSFVKERNQLLTMYEKEEEKEREKANKTPTMTYQEWQERKRNKELKTQHYDK